MKLRTLLILAVGLALGYKLAKRATEDDPYVVKGPQREQSNGRPTFRVITGQAQRLAGQASGKSLDAIRGARRALQSRLADTQDDAAWN
ncbi:MAG TPA: hypothetical protein VGR41_03105 [Actinomycetota bacterium]|jgi:hypothetical protein|nr:hypothetical protein [Actinomycetota bacterium]